MGVARPASGAVRPRAGSGHAPCAASSTPGTQPHRGAALIVLSELLDHQPSGGREQQYLLRLPVHKGPAHGWDVGDKLLGRPVPESDRQGCRCARLQHPRQFTKSP
jgi:hypothetical protein